MALQWLPITGLAGHGPRNALYVGGTEVARLDERIGGGWMATLRPPGHSHVIKRCTDQATGRAGCEAWARRHIAALEAYDERRHLAWLARQTWRGLDSRLAQQRLADLDQKGPAAPASLQGPAWLDYALAGEGGRPEDGRGRSESGKRAPYVAGEASLAQAAVA